MGIGTKDLCAGEGQHQFSTQAVSDSRSEKHIKVWKEQKYGHRSRRGPKPRTTVLAKASGNLLDWTGVHENQTHLH
jgi:hypothetical protein